MEGRHRARGVAQDYNNLDAKSVPYEKIADVRFDLLQKIVGHVGSGTFIEPPFNPDYGCNVSIGRDCFFNFNPRHQPDHHRRSRPVRPQRQHLHRGPRRQRALAPQVRRVRPSGAHRGRLLDRGKCCHPAGCHHRSGLDHRGWVRRHQGHSPVLRRGRKPMSRAKDCPLGGGGGAGSEQSLSQYGARG
ncbi:hypothetical protein BO70DRAFT_156688 [Aspergillus heteromorphus CBS 117.55]|uniref:Maltose/galactoside acetyltransferase domain-containing protein n=1 Tax=Aspergillus heteromorphus CBS 117.55 TaxID=1448321 RepID=A0A317V522_9EURO|nr:uncharacterized protein BO70DRAFT_156688 [Aspergillus heteromorphus CBS 117.55]PWY67932.1 hypothetical protein BO70DRAFT_156688 [Aspergillus heteromorphus CBS 117.55]